MQGVKPITQMGKYKDNYAFKLSCMILSQKERSLYHHWASGLQLCKIIKKIEVEIPKKQSFAI